MTNNKKVGKTGVLLSIRRAFAKCKIFGGYSLIAFFMFPFGIKLNGQKIFSLLTKPCKNNTLIHFITVGQPC